MNTYIFDLDGTLVDSIESIAYFANSALEEYGIQSVEVEKYKGFVGDGARTLIRRAMEYRGSSSPELLEQVLRRYNETYDDNYLYLCKVYEGIDDLIRALRDRGFKTGVLSNKPHSTTVKIVEALFGKESFDFVYGQREGVALKPHPDSILNLIESHSLKREDCVYVGDTMTDVMTGKNAGIFTVGVLWGFRDREELETYGADKIAALPVEVIVG